MTVKFCGHQPIVRLLKRFCVFRERLEGAKQEVGLSQEALVEEQQATSQLRLQARSAPATQPLHFPLKDALHCLGFYVLVYMARAVQAAFFETTLIPTSHVCHPCCIHSRVPVPYA